MLNSLTSSMKSQGWPGPPSNVDFLRPCSSTLFRAGQRLENGIHKITKSFFTYLLLLLMVQWILYIKTTLGTNKMWSLYTGGLYMQVHKHGKYIPKDLQYVCFFHCL